MTMSSANSVLKAPFQLRVLSGNRQVRPRNRPAIANEVVLETLSLLTLIRGVLSCAVVTHFLATILAWQIIQK